MKFNGNKSEQKPKDDLASKEKQDARIDELKEGSTPGSVNPGGKIEPGSDSSIKSDQIIDEKKDEKIEDKGKSKDDSKKSSKDEKKDSKDHKESKKKGCDKCNNTGLEIDKPINEAQVCPACKGSPYGEPKK